MRTTANNEDGRGDSTKQETLRDVGTYKNKGNQPKAIP